MAIVFISPKVKQKSLLKTAVLLIILALVVASLVFFITGFLNKSQVISPKTAFHQPDVAINFNVIDSDKVKNLEPFYNLETEFAYVVVDKNGKQIQGNISAASQEDAKKLLEESGFKVSSLKEVVVGNSNPFVNY